MKQSDEIFNLKDALSSSFSNNNIWWKSSYTNSF